MQKLGMTHDPADDFGHPNLPAGHPLRRHLLYRLSRQQWSQARATAFRASSGWRMPLSRMGRRVWQRRKLKSLQVSEVLE